MVYKNLTGDEVRYTEDDFENNPELEAELAQIGSTLVREKKVTIEARGS